MEICGIQQMGIGVPDVQEIWKWYRKFFGVDIKVFEDAAEAPLMTIYTGGVVQNRTATFLMKVSFDCPAIFVSTSSPEMK